MKPSGRCLDELDFDVQALGNSIGCSMLEIVQEVTEMPLHHVLDFDHWRHSERSTASLQKLKK